MSMTIPQARQAVVSYHGDSLQIVIPAKKDGFMILFLTIWLIIWAVAEIASPVALMNYKDEGIGVVVVLVVWLIVWTIGGLYAMFAWLWNTQGKEIISVSGQYLSVKNDVLGFGRWRQYESTQIRNLRVSKGNESWGSLDYTMQCWGLAGGLLAFEYGTRLYRFGMGVDESAAKEILHRIVHRYPWLALKH
jgi:hypothetical protein